MKFGKLNVEFKGVKTFNGREGLALNANIYVNGVNTCFYNDDASGGGGDVRDYSVKNRPLYEALCAEMAKKPEVVSDIFGKTISWAYDWDDLSNDLLGEYENAKHERKIQKLCEVAIVWGTPGKEYAWRKFKLPISQIPVDIIKKNMPVLKPGEVIYNMNIAI